MAMNLAIAPMLGWVLGGNVENLSLEDRLPYCNLNDKPKGFNEAVGAHVTLLHAAPIGLHKLATLPSWRGQGASCELWALSRRLADSCGVARCCKCCSPISGTCAG